MRKSLLIVPFLFLHAGASPCGAAEGPDPGAAREIVRRYVERGEAAIPELRLALKSEDPAVRAQARSALGRITGQWGGEGEIVWKRSLAEAVNKDRPILVLQLFGKFDEEFC